MIDRLSSKNQNKLWECDYSCITSAILPYYFHVTHDNAWVITPKYNHLEANHPDYTIFRVMANPTKLHIHALVEIKSKSGDSLNKLLEQMYSQCDVAKNDQGRLWAIGQKGFEICFFRFDVLKYGEQQPDYYTNYEPLNLSNPTEPELNNLNV